MEKPIIACTLSDDGLATRGERWRRLAGASGVDVAVTPSGLRLTFGPGSENELGELAALERDCCAFADWTVTGTVLEVSGRGDAVPAVQAMFSSLR
jgi:hypothetical protein